MSDPDTIYEGLATAINDPEKGEQIDDDKSGFWATVFNILNVYVGLGLLGQPFALGLGGWSALIFMVISCLLSMYTARLTVRCFEHLPLSMYHDDGGYQWPNLAHFVLGGTAKWILAVLTLLEFAGAGCTGMLMVWECLSLLLPSLPFAIIALIASTLTAIIVMTGNLNSLSILNLLGTMSKFLMAYIPFLVWFTQNDEWQAKNRPHHDFIVFKKFPMAMGVVMLAFSAHVCLPAIYSNMKDPRQFDRAVTVSFLTMFAFYATCSIFGYLMFGTDLSPLITKDISMAITTVWQKHLMTFVNGLVAWSIFSTNVAIVVFLATFLVYLVPHGTRQQVPLRVFKFGTVLLMAGITLILRRCLGTLESMLGLTALIITLLCPLVFNYLMFNKEMSCAFSAVQLVIIFLCALTVIPILISNFY